MLVRSFITTLFTMLLYGAMNPAAAAAEGRDTPENLAVWIFLGFCALIIIVQLGTLVRGPRRDSEDGIEPEKAAEHSETQ